MAFTDSIKRMIGIEDLDDDDMITEEEVNQAKERITGGEVRPSFAEAGPRKSLMTTAKPAEKRFSVANTSAFRLVLIEPKSFEECPKLVDCLKGRRPVIINLEKLETEVARKIFDFMSGATYALSGNVQKVANNIFIFAPENVDIAATQPAERSGFASEDAGSIWR
ncbi:MAG: cell division protein SepF [Firmicutes bacterium]|nr:cell division protein SepF [Bacillota bacterium]